MTSKSNRDFSKQPSITVSKASSLLRVSSLEFDKIYNRHQHMKAKLLQKHRRIQIEKNKQQRINTIMREKEQLKFTLINHNDDSGKILQDQTLFNTELKRKRYQAIKNTRQNQYQLNFNKAVEIKKQTRDNHMKKKLTNQNDYLQSYMKRKQLHQGYYQAIKNTHSKNKLYRNQIKEDNKKDIQKMLKMKKQIDLKTKKFKKLEVAIQEKLSQTNKIQ